jgi:hypothetical protein
LIWNLRSSGKLKELGLDEELEVASSMTTEQSESLIAESTAKFGLVSTFIFILLLSVTVDTQSFHALEEQARNAIVSSPELVVIDWDKEFLIGDEERLNTLLESPSGEARKMALMKTLTYKRFDSTYAEPRVQNCTDFS